MRLSTFVKLAGAAAVAVMVLLGSQGGAQTGASAASTATAMATMSAPAMTMAATMAAPAMTMAATMASANVTYPPCTANATASAAGMTAPATMAATPMANDNPGYLGIKARNVDTCGAMIDEVVGTPAKLAKLQAGDVVVAVDGIKLDGLNTFRAYVEAHKPGSTVVLTIQRNGTQMDISVTLGERSTSALATQAATAAQ